MTLAESWFWQILSNFSTAFTKYWSGLMGGIFLKQRWPPPTPLWVSIFKKFPSQATCMYCTSIRMQIYTCLLFKCLGAVIPSGLFFPRSSSLLWDGHSSLLCNYLACRLGLRKMSGGLQSPPPRPPALQKRLGLWLPLQLPTDCHQRLLSPSGCHVGRKCSCSPAAPQFHSKEADAGVGTGWATTTGIGNGSVYS